jgi:hypothetical protein
MAGSGFQVSTLVVVSVSPRYRARRLVSLASMKPTVCGLGEWCLRLRLAERTSGTPICEAALFSSSWAAAFPEDVLLGLRTVGPAHPPFIVATPTRPIHGSTALESRVNCWAGSNRVLGDARHSDDGDAHGAVLRAAPVGANRLASREFGLVLLRRRRRRLGQAACQLCPRRDT